MLHSIVAQHHSIQLNLHSNIEWYFESFNFVNTYFCLQSIQMHH